MENNYGSDLARYSTCSIVGRLIEKNKTVLDVGCNDGYLKKASHGSNVFYGLDRLGESIKIAKEKNGYQDALCLDLEKIETNPFGVEFDVIVCADVLEHLVFPEKSLHFLMEKFLKKDGRVIISLPNVAHFSTRLDLIFGKFDYGPSGILDRTHLHLYTQKSARKMIRSCGLEIIKEEFSSNNFGGILKKIPFLGTILGYNLIYICKRRH